MLSRMKVRPTWLFFTSTVFEDDELGIEPGCLARIDRGRVEQRPRTGVLIAALRPSSPIGAVRRGAIRHSGMPLSSTVLLPLSFGPPSMQ